MLKQQDNRHYLGKVITAFVDRALGSKHPTHGFRYTVNYGNIPGTLSGDGEELDAYILGVNEPLAEFTGTCIAIIHRFNDNDDKLVLVPTGIHLSDAEIRRLTHFQEQWFESEIIRPDPENYSPNSHPDNCSRK